MPSPVLSGCCGIPLSGKRKCSEVQLQDGRPAIQAAGSKYLNQSGYFLSRIAAMIHFVFYIFLREKRLSLFDLWCA